MSPRKSWCCAVSPGFSCARDIEGCGAAVTSGSPKTNCGPAMAAEQQQVCLPAVNNIAPDDHDHSSSMMQCVKIALVVWASANTQQKQILWLGS